MTFGKRITQVRKENNMSQEALAKALNATPTTVGRYERDEVKPSIEVATNIADVLGVSLDFLTGNSKNNFKDQSMVQRIDDILSLQKKDREYILFAIDALIRDAKARKAYA